MTSLRPYDVLLADDDPDLRELMVDVLREEGFRVRGVCHGGDALRALQDEALPAVVVLDLEMPVLDGASLCRRLREDVRFEALPLVVVSAQDSSALAPIVQGRLRKPFDLDELLALIRGLVTRRSASPE